MPAEPISVLWFDSKGCGPDEFALQLNPLPELKDGDEVICKPTRGLMIRPRQVVILGRAMINGGFQMHRASVADLHRQLGEWLTANPENA